MCDSVGKCLELIIYISYSLSRDILSILSSVDERDVPLYLIA